MKDISENEKYFKYIDVLRSDSIANIYPDGSKRDWREILAYPSAHMFTTGCITRRLGKNPDFEWKRFNYSGSAFDDINFRYKNQVFSILLQFSYNGEEIPVNEKRKKDFLSIAKQNNLVPCFFPVDIIDDDKQYTIHRKTDGWNLFDAETGVSINPIQMSSDEPVQMSHYELLNKAITIIETELENKGFEVRATCDDPSLPEDYPRIWFSDDEGLLCWAVVKYGYGTDKNFKDPDVNYIIQDEELLQDSKGYFAPVVFESKDKPIYRNPKITINLLKNVVTKIYDISEDVE